MKTSLKSLNKLEGLLHALLELGTDAQQNISLLVRSCGELLDADACLYNRIEGELISTIAGWRIPPRFKNIDRAKGHLCYNVVKRNQPDKILLIKNLPHTSYYKTDLNIRTYGLKTYAGFPVSYAGKIRGALCVVYKKNVDLTKEEILIMELIATFIGIEEDRRILNAQLYKRIEFEKLISQLSSHFINLSFNQTDKAINTALKEIGEFCDVDRSYIFLTYERGKKVRNTHEWCAEGISPSIDKLQEVEV
ncbi:MAG: GAF domain-containing protein, partial [Candidatus Omnitrophica bacterium]|nr:GAF domain-containing protein [Candidatus Omnitrophota bacterium]